MYCCKKCDKKFEKRHSLAAHCSAAHTKRIIQKLQIIQVEKNCLRCKNLFIVDRKIDKNGQHRIVQKERKFCDNCYKIREKSGKTKKQISNCIECNKEFLSYYNRSGLCSNKCKKDYNWRKIVNNAIEKNNFSPIKKPGMIRQLLFFHYPHKCQNCGIEKWNNQKVPLTMDHINGDSDDWRFNNLRLICRNCDGLLPTFAGRNIGKHKKISSRMLYNKERKNKIGI